MAIDTTWVRHGAPAAEALWRAVRDAKGGDPLAPVTVLVPSNHLGVATRRQLAAGSLGPVCPPGVGLAAVTFATPFRLGELLGASALAAQGRRPVSTPVVAAAVRAALAEQAGLFAPVAAHPATEAALVATYRELRGATAAQLAHLATRSPRAGDVVRLHRAVRGRLEAAWYDEDDLMAAAVAALAAGGGAELGVVVVHLPQRVTPGVAALVGAVAAQRPVHVLAGCTGHPGADAEVAVGVALLDPAAPPAPAAAAPLAGVVAADATRIVLTADADDEVRAAVRRVVDAARAGTALDRVAVLYASPRPYARLVHEQLAAAGISSNGSAVVPLAGRVAGRTLLALLDWPTNGYRRSDLLALLRGAPVLLGGRPAPVAAWERVARAAAVVGGRAHWDERLTVHAEGREAHATTFAADPERPGWLAERAHREAGVARRLRALALELIDDLEAAAARPRPWEEHVAWARAHLVALLGGEAARAPWPTTERQAAERVEVALDRLGALGRVEGPVSLDVFARTLGLELEADLAREGRFGEGVLVGSVGLATGLDLDLVVVLGMAEGTFPAPVGDDSLLPDHDRAAIGLPRRGDQVERQHHQLLAALAGARRHHLGVPRGDLRRSALRVPSRWVLDVAGQLAGRRQRSGELVGVAAPWLVDVASFDAGLRAVAFPATEQEHRLRALLADEAVTTDDAVMAAGVEVLTARRGPAFTRFDGNLAGLPVPSPVERTTSSTRLQQWAGCPFDYFLHVVLGVEEVEDPDEQLEITPLDKGNLVHEALEHFVEEVLARPTPPAPDQAWTPADRARLRAIAGAVCDGYEARGLTGRALFWRRGRAAVLAELEQVLTHDDAYRRHHGTRPVAAELAFGGRREVTVALPLPDGRSLRLRGKADRVDLGADGRVHVVDYKTGSTRGYQDLGPDNPDGRGRHLQLAVYGLAARAHLERPDAPVRADYWFVSRKGDYKRMGYEITPDVLAQVGATIATVVAGIEGGVFPSRPTTQSTALFNPCPACDPDFLGVRDLRRGWERKRADPLVAAYAAFAEGDGADGDEEGDDG